MTDNGNRRKGQELLIGDLAKHLNKWAVIEQDERTGNPSLGEGLTLLAACLKRHRSSPVGELAQLQLGRSEHRVSPNRKFEIELPNELDSLGWEEIGAILDNEHFRKIQLVELGFQRLGIPRSKLSRLSRADAITSLRAALDHERSLVAVERHARIAGERRTA